jgi:hypothetical protein
MVAATVNSIPRKLVDVPATRARFYQQVAWDTVQNFTIEKLEAAEAKRKATP